MISDLTRRGLFGFGGAASLWGLTSCDAVVESLSDQDEILVNQIGYFKHGPMRIQVRSHEPLRARMIEFDLVEHRSGTVVAGTYGPLEKTSLPEVGVANLSWPAQAAKQDEKLYHLQSGPVSSAPFKLSASPFAQIERALTRALYLQRCGIALDDSETGLSHDACHLHDAISRRTGAPHDCAGGWHDAGDFGKYVATTAVVIGELLSLYAEDPSRFGDGQVGLPESGNGEADLLSEMRVGLTWLLKMQRADGAFERKIGGDHWPSMHTMPEGDLQERFVYGISTADTARAAAALAIAGRVFEGVDAKRFVVAATKAWTWLEDHPEPGIDHLSGDDDGSGPYLNSSDLVDYQDGMDRLWVALELYLTTGDETCRAAIAYRAKDMFIWPASWANPSLIGLLNYLRDTSRDDVEGLRPEIEKKLIVRANEYEMTGQLSPWGVATEEFGWGSNRDVAGRGGILVAAFERTGDEKFFHAALAQANYILGSNAFGLSFVTGLGENPVRNPHHRFDLAVRYHGTSVGVPGLLVGGPNSDAPLVRQGTPAGAGRYLDHASSFETNEFAIDYNAALIALLGRLSATPLKARPDFADRVRRWMGL